MSEKQEIFQQEIFQKYLNRPKGMTRKVFSETVGLTDRQMKRLLAKMRKGNVIPEPAPEDDDFIGTNEAVLSGEAESIDDLLGAHSLNPDDWEIQRVLVNSWEMGRKDKKHNLKWESGVVSGKSKDSGGINKAKLRQLKVWLVRKNPIALRPVIQPIHIKREPVHSYHLDIHKKSGYRCGIVLPDPQIGFKRNLRTGVMTPSHDRLALESACLVAQLVGADTAVWLGDFLDLPDVSDKFVRSPEHWNVTQPSIFEGAYWLSRIGNIVSEHVVLEGNHEKRVETSISKYMSWAYDLHAVGYDALSGYPVLSVPHLLGFDVQGIEWVPGYPNNRYWLGGVAIEHGLAVSAAPGTTAQKVINDNRTNSVIFGHVHRYEAVTKVLRSRNNEYVITAMCPGGLCDMHEVPGKRFNQNWTQGVAVVYWNPRDESDYHIVHYPIQDGEVFVGGELYKAQDRTDEIRSLGSKYNIF